MELEMMPENDLNSNSVPEKCPSDLELAALLDGTLEAARAEEVRLHVLACPNCSEIFADAHEFEVEPRKVIPTKILPFQKLPKPPTRPAPVATPAIVAPPARRKRGRWSLFPMAAGFVLAAISAYLVWPNLGPARPQPFTNADLQEADLLSSDAFAALPQRPVQRAESSPEATTFAAWQLLGSHRVDLGVALARRSSSQVYQFVGWILQDTVPLKPQLEPQILKDLADLRMAIPLTGTGEDPPLELKLAARIRATADALASDGTKKEPGQDNQDFGFWSEAGRVAAATEQLKYFQGEKNQGFLAWLQAQHAEGASAPNISLSEAGKSKLEEIAKAWPDDGKPAEFGVLATAFAQLQADALSQVARAP